MDPHKYSASQIETYQDCPRKWAFGTIWKIRGPGTGAAQLGGETHKQLETYLAGGSLDFTRPSGEIAASGIHHLPLPPLPPESLESRFEFTSPETGFAYHGIRDVYLPGLVLDHKTTSDFQYAKTPVTLATDVQAIIYAYSAQAPLVQLRWVYYRTKGARKSHVVETELTRAHVEKEFARIELTVSQMQIILDDVQGSPHRALDLTRELPPNPEACEKYGGCPHRHICNLSPSERLASFFTQTKENTMSVADLISRLKAKSEPTVVEVKNEGTLLQSVTTFSEDFINPPALTESPPVLEMPTPAKRGRPKKEKAPEIELPETETVYTAEVVRKGFSLFVDCVPDGHVQDMSFVYAIAKKAVAEKCEVQDYRLVDFGKGPGMLSLALEDLIDAGTLSGNVFVSTACHETMVCLSLLVSRASCVTRAVR